MVSNSWPNTRVTPANPELPRSAMPIWSTGAAPVYEDLPQYSAGCALKICSPLISRIVSATTFNQCMIRTGSA